MSSMRMAGLTPSAARARPLPAAAATASGAGRRGVPALRAHLPCASSPANSQGHSRIVKRDVKGFREIYVRAFECEDCSRK